MMPGSDECSLDHMLSSVDSSHDDEHDSCVETSCKFTIGCHFQSPLYSFSACNLGQMFQICISLE